MRKWGIPAACLPIFVGAAVAGTPAHYLDEQRCLAVLNIAAAAFSTIEEPGHALHALREDVENGYGRLKILIAAERDLTDQQIDKGLDVFDGEQQHWLHPLGDAPQEKEPNTGLEVLMKKARHCVKELPG